DDDIALACVTRLGADGYEVLVAGTATTCGRSGAARSVAVDLAEPAASAAAIGAAAAGWPALHALVNCHLHVEPGGVGDLDLTAWQRALDVNATGPLAVTRALLGPLAAAGGASVV